MKYTVKIIILSILLSCFFSSLLSSEEIDKKEVAKKYSKYAIECYDSDNKDIFLSLVYANFVLDLDSNLIDAVFLRFAIYSEIMFATHPALQNDIGKIITKDYDKLKSAGGEIFDAALYVAQLAKEKGDRHKVNTSKEEQISDFLKKLDKSRRTFIFKHFKNSYDVVYDTILPLAKTNMKIDLKSKDLYKTIYDKIPKEMKYIQIADKILKIALSDIELERIEYLKTLSIGDSFNDGVIKEISADRKKVLIKQVNSSQLTWIELK